MRPSPNGFPSSFSSASRTLSEEKCVCASIRRDDATGGRASWAAGLAADPRHDGAARGGDQRPAVEAASCLGGRRALVR